MPYSVIQIGSEPAPWADMIPRIEAASEAKREAALYDEAIALVRTGSGTDWDNVGMKEPGSSERRPVCYLLSLSYYGR